MKKTLLNLGLFQLGWMACVLGGNGYAVAFTLFALSLHQWLVLEHAREWKLIGTVALVGCLWDVGMAQAGVIRYADGLLAGIPLWLVCLWLIFATTFMHSLFWLRAYPVLAALLAAVFGPASYWVGCNLTDAELRAPELGSLAIMSLGWALLFPLGLWFAAKLNQPLRSTNEQAV